MKWFILTVVACVLVGCGSQSAALAEGIQAMYEAGQLTETQRLALDGLVNDTGWSWMDLIEPVATLVAGYFGIRLWRGTPDNRRGVTVTT